jgi:hypothetical protein
VHLFANLKINKRTNEQEFGIYYFFIFFFLEHKIRYIRSVDIIERTFKTLLRLMTEYKSYEANLLI